MNKYIILILSLLMVPNISLAAGDNCKPRDEVVKFYVEEFDARQVAKGLTSPIDLLEIWQSGDGKLFSVVISNAVSGESCLIIGGRHFIINSEEEAEKSRILSTE